jgi:hypothetical protein
MRSRQQQLGTLKHEFRANIIYEFSPYRKENMTLHDYKDQLVDDVQGNSRCLQWEPYETHKYTLWAKCRVTVC